MFTPHSVPTFSQGLPAVNASHAFVNSEHCPLLLSGKGTSIPIQKLFDKAAKSACNWSYKTQEKVH